MIFILIFALVIHVFNPRLFIFLPVIRVFKPWLLIIARVPCEISYVCILIFFIAYPAVTVIRSKGCGGNSSTMLGIGKLLVCTRDDLCTWIWKLPSRPIGFSGIYTTLTTPVPGGMEGLCRERLTQGLPDCLFTLTASSLQAGSCRHIYPSSITSELSLGPRVFA